MKTIYENPLISEAAKYPDSLFLFKNVKGVDMFYCSKAKEIRELSFKDVDFLKDTIMQPNEVDMFKSIRLVFGNFNPRTTKLLQFYQAYNYIVEKIKEIWEQEKALISEPSEKLKAAGIERMQIFGNLNILDDIAQRYSKSPLEIENWSYSLIFALSLKMKYESDIQKNIEDANRRNTH